MLRMIEQLVLECGKSLVFSLLSEKYTCLILPSFPPRSSGFDSHVILYYCNRSLFVILDQQRIECSKCDTSELFSNRVELNRKEVGGCCTVLQV